MTDATSLFLLRHAEVEIKYHRVFGGQIDMELSAEGHAQADALAKYLKPRSFDAIYASPMIRAQQTLKPLLAGRDQQPVVLAGLKEVDFGAWTGLGWTQVQEQFGVSAFQWLHLLESGTIPKAESAATFRERVEPCLRTILENHPGQSVAILCHGGTIRMILSILMDLPLSRMASFEIEYASVSQVHCAAHRTEVQLLNFTPWRDIP